MISMLSEIDARAKELEKFEQMNFSVDEKYLESYQGIFAALEHQLYSKPYKMPPGQCPPYYPENGVLFDAIAQSDPAQDAEILNELED